MSFLKITDPAKRDLIVNEFLKSKRAIQQASYDEKVGDFGLQREFTELYKPITDSQSGLNSQLAAIQEALTGTNDALKALPSAISTQLKAITLPQYPSIQAFEDPAEHTQTINFGEIATEYLKNYDSNKKYVDTTFGIYSKDGQFYIGTEPITIDGNNITVGDKTYQGTPGLWELLNLSKPNKSIYNSNDLENYGEILN